MSTAALGAQFTREHFREAARLGQIAQEQRAQRSSLGYTPELRTFYRGRNRPQTDDSEQRITVAAADKEHAALRAADAEQAAHHRPMTPEEHASYVQALDRNGW